MSVVAQWMKLEVRHTSQYPRLGRQSQTSRTGGVRTVVGDESAIRPLCLPARHLLLDDRRHQRFHHRVGASEAQPAETPHDVTQLARRDLQLGGVVLGDEQSPHGGRHGSCPRPPGSDAHRPPCGARRSVAGPSSVRVARQVAPRSKRMVGSCGPWRNGPSVRPTSTSNSSARCRSTAGASPASRDLLAPTPDPFTSRSLAAGKKHGRRGISFHFPQLAYTTQPVLAMRERCRNTGRSMRTS
jgi:hypothetical protein